MPEKNSYFLKYSTPEGVKEASYDYKDFYDAAKRYVIQQFGPNAIIESKEPMNEGTVTLLNE